MYIKEYHQAKKVNKSHIDIMQIILKMKNNKKLLKIRVLVYKIVFYILQAYRKFKQIKNFTIILKELY